MYDYKKLKQIPIQWIGEQLYGLSFSKHGGHCLKCNEHDSLIININRNSFRWYSHSMEENSYGDAISFVRGMSMNLNGEVLSPGQACKILTALSENKELPVCDEYSNNSADTSIYDLVLPKVDTRMSHVYAYLLKERKVDKSIVDLFVRNKLIQQVITVDSSGNEHKNMMFCGRFHNMIVNAHINGISAGFKYKSVLPGSQVNVGFRLNNGHPESVRLFESMIDCMSYMTLQNKYYTSWVPSEDYVICNSVYNAKGVLAFNLFHYTNVETLTSVILSLDNDEAGVKAGNYCECFIKECYPNVHVKKDVSSLHDWNDDLKALNASEKDRNDETMEVNNG